MNTAISLDTAGVKWPFAPQSQPQPQPQGRGSRPSTPRPDRSPISGFPVPATATAPTVVAPVPVSTLPDSVSVPAPVPAPEAVALPAVPASTGISGVYADNLARAKPARRTRVQEIGSGMFVHQAQTVGALRRQMVGDVVLVGAWAVMIPAVLWLGHAAGF